MVTATPTLLLFGSRVSEATKQAMRAQLLAEEIPVDFGPFESGATHCELFPLPKAERVGMTAEQLTARRQEMLAKLAGAHVVLVQSTGEQPNVSESLEQVRSAVSTLKQCGVGTVTLASANMAYDRQDRDFAETGQLCSVNAQWLAQEMKMRGVDRVITCAPHSEATMKFWRDALGDANYHPLAATALFAEDIKARFGDMANVMIGAPDGADKPNDQGQARAKALAEALHGADNPKSHQFFIGKKHTGTNETEVTSFEGDVAGKDCVLIDDMSDGGSTLVKAAKTLKDNGAKSVTAYVTHAICTEKTLAAADGSTQVKSGLKRVLELDRGNPVIDHFVVTDSIPEIEQKIAALPEADQARVSTLSVGLLIAAKVQEIAQGLATEDRQAAGAQPAMMQEKLTLPEWSTLDRPAVLTDKTGTMGAFCVYYSWGEGMVAAGRRHKRDPLVAIVERAAIGPDGKPLSHFGGYGLPGGYMDLGGRKTAGEQPKEGATRELGEEVISAPNAPIIAPDPASLQPLHAQVSYRNPGLPAGNFGFKSELTDEQLQAMKRHAEKLKSDPEYRDISIAASHGETLGLRIMPLSEALKLGRENFTHKHEFEALECLARDLQKQRGILQR